MKKIKSMILIMTSVLAITSLYSIKVKAADNQVSKAKAAYKGMIMDSYHDANPIQFCVIDINEDGVPELIKKYDINYTNIYTYHKGKVIILDYFFGCHYLDGYYKNKNIYIHNFASQGNWTYYNSINGVNVRNEALFAINGPTDTMLYEINDKETTKAKIDKYIKSLGKLQKFQYSNVNSTNIKKYLSNTQKLTLVKGKTNKLVLNKQNADKVTWTSNNKAVVTVDKNGKTIAHKNGKATVIATVKYPTYTEKYKFNVIVKVKSIPELAISEYKKFLIDKEKEWIKSGDYGAPQFELLDINKDGVKELIYTDWTTTYYTFAKGRMVEIGSLFEGFQYYNSSEKYIIHMVSDGDLYYEIYKMENNMFERVTSIIFHCWSNGGYDENGPYTKDGKKISKAEAEKYITKKHEPGEEHANTADMRSKYLK